MTAMDHQPRYEASITNAPTADMTTSSIDARPNQSLCARSGVTTAAAFVEEWFVFMAANITGYDNAGYGPVNHRCSGSRRY